MYNDNAKQGDIRLHQRLHLLAFSLQQFMKENIMQGNFPYFNHQHHFLDLGQTRSWTWLWRSHHGNVYTYTTIAVPWGHKLMSSVKEEEEPAGRDWEEWDGGKKKWVHDLHFCCALRRVSICHVMMRSLAAKFNCIRQTLCFHYQSLKMLKWLKWAGYHLDDTNNFICNGGSFSSFIPWRIMMHLCLHVQTDEFAISFGDSFVG